MNRTAAFAFFLLVYLLTMSGTIASSDGHTMFRLTGALLERGAVDVVAESAVPGLAGKLYPKAGVGQALASAPLYFVAARVCDAVPRLAARREACLRFAVQLLAPLCGALVCAAFLSLLLDLGVPAGAAFLGTCLLGLGTLAWPYAKFYCSEPLTAWLLLVSFAELVRYRAGGRTAGVLRAALAASFAVVVKATMALPAAALFAYFVFAWRSRRGRAGALAAALLPALACAAVVLAYNHARFGGWLQSGYGVEQTGSAYGTPLLVGLYGQLFSTGKGLFLFAPPLLLLFPAARRFAAEHRAEAWTLAGVVLPSLLVNSKFRAWAADGSWGPRYLVPFVPLLMVPVGLALARSRTLRRWGAVLLAVGMLVQWGGVSVYFGSYLREAGAYPYTRAFEDPRFLEDVHWVPNFSPVAGHWRMFARDLGEHLRGEYPRVSLAKTGGGEGPGRIQLSPEDQAKLLHGMDLWFLYLLYTGIASPRVLAVAALLALLALAALAAALKSARAAPGAA